MNQGTFSAFRKTKQHSRNFVRCKRQDYHFDKLGEQETLNEKGNQCKAERKI